MIDITISKINESVLEVRGSEDILHDLYSRYSEYQAGYQFNPRFKNRIWDGKIHLFNIRTGILPAGFLIDLLMYCKQNNVNYELDGFRLEDLKEPLDEQQYLEEIENNMEDSGKTLRDYQDQAVRKALTYRKGILLSCTGSGKSLMLYNIIRCLRKRNFKKILLIVPNIILIGQMRNDFVEYGYPDADSEITMLGGGNKPDFSCPVLISTWESLQNKESTFFEDFDAVFVDECHGGKASKLLNIVNHCVNARYKIGTTGTLPTDKADMLKIKSILGNVIFELKSKELIDQGVLTTLQIANVLLKYPIDFIMTNKDRSYPEEVKMVEEYSRRNKALQVIIDHTDKSHNMLVLVNHIAHLNDVKQWINDNYPDRKVSIINGSIKSKDREEIRVGLENEDGTILLATYATMSTGVNIPKLHEVILYANSKSKIKVLQSIGRGLRKHKTKSKIVLYDIVDDLSYPNKKGKPILNYLMKHWMERMAYYTEQEFPTVSMELPLE